MERLFSTHEVATRLAVDKKTVLRYLRRDHEVGLGCSDAGQAEVVPVGAPSVQLARRSSPANHWKVVTTARAR